MAASPISKTIARITLAEDAVIHLASTAMFKARSYGKRTRDPIAAIFDDRIKRQARRLLVQAAMHLNGSDALFARKMLALMSGYDLAGANDEALAEICAGISDAAREAPAKRRERMGA